MKSVTTAPVTVAAILTAGIGAVGGSAWAHHSTAMYDQAHLITLTGTVKEFNWENPHSTITLIVTDGDSGSPRTWHLIGGGVNSLIRYGWTKDLLKPGMKAKFLIAPMRDGKLGGDYKGLLEIDGKKVAIRSGTFHDKD